MRTCWTCLAEHEIDAPCRLNPTVRGQQLEGSPGFTIGDRTADLFEAPEDRGYGPIFTATYEGEDACCGDGVEVGDRIRSDGGGGWIHANGECDA